MSMALCTGCKKVMTHVEFDQHDCPASPGPPLDGESWDDYADRCDKFKKEWEEEYQRTNDAMDALSESMNPTLPQLDSHDDGPIDGYDY